VTCTLCPLHKEALTICVPGRGASPARVMLVGQAPGVKEDCAGEAFVGKAGHLLDEMLRDAGYDERDVFLTNAVRCKPPVEKGTFSERAPNTDEIDACRVHLTNEIHRVRPDVIVALGDVALRSLTRLAGISGKRGRSFSLHKMFAYDCEVWPTFHPAYVLRVPASRPTVTVDLRRIRDRSLEHEQLQYGRFYPPDQGGETVGFRTNTFALDIETIDRDGKVVDAPTQIAFAADDGVWVGEWPINFSWEGALVTHNGLEFDLPKLGIAPEGYDTMYLAHLCDENQPLNLEALCVKYLGVRGWKEDRDAPLGSEALALYNARDAVYTLRLFHRLRDELGPRIRLYEQILLPARLALNACSARGLWIDDAAVERTSERVDAQIDSARHRVTALASEWVDVTKFNPNSSRDVAVVLTEMGYELPRTRKTGALRVDKSVLQAIPEPLAGALLDYRAATKQKSTYVTPYRKAARSGTHRMHNEYTVIRTVVGRTSARRSNVQNLDRELEFFGAPPRAFFARADYSALHFRLAAWCAGAHSILDRYAADPRWDPHLFFASSFYNKPEAAITRTGPHSERQIAKSANFSQLYLGDEHTLQNYAAGRGGGIALELPFCRALHVTWHRTFPEFIPWYARVWDELLEHGFVETATGRRRHFGDVRLLNKLGRAAAHREAVNFKVLGLEPDIALLGLSACHRAGLPVNGFFHDAVSFEFDNLSALRDNEQEIRRCMIETPLAILRDEFGADITVPLDTDLTVYDKETT
jgi:uracil-DNA glycosylase